MIIQENISLASRTTLGVGGPARYFAEARSEAEVVEAVESARSRGLPLFILGGGSNVVVADAGFAGLVLKVGITEVARSDGFGGAVMFAAGAGCDWDALVEQTVEAGCAGLECLSGIPGTVGGTPIQNVGAYGQEVSQSIEQVRALDLRSLEVKTLNGSDCGFGYRSSMFNTAERGRYIVFSVSFALRPGGKPNLRYPDLQQFFVGATEPTLREVRAAVREIRHRKAMLIVPGEEDARSAGSFFKNPVLPQPFVDELSARLAVHGSRLTTYPAGDGYRKLPAAWLVEHAGFSKGYCSGRAGISRKHALAIVNRGGATAAEIVALKDAIQQRVFDQFGIMLEPEPVFVGF